MSKRKPGRSFFDELSDDLRVAEAAEGPFTGEGIARAKQQRRREIERKCSTEPELSTFFIVTDSNNERRFLGYGGHVIDPDSDVITIYADHGASAMSPRMIMGKDHARCWKAMKELYRDRSFADVFERDYKGFPRGLVVYTPDNEYYVVCSEEIVKDTKVQQLIIEACGLPPDILFKSDPTLAIKKN